MGRLVAGAGLHLAQHGVHDVLAHGHERQHVDPRVAVEIERIAAALFHQVLFVPHGLQEVQRALPVKMRQIPQQLQRDVAAVFQLAQMRHRDADLVAHLLQGVALLLAQLPPFLARELFGVLLLRLLADALLKIAAVLTAAQQQLDGVRAHMLVDGVLLDTLQRRQIVHCEDPIVAVRALDGDQPRFFPVADGAGHHAQNFGHLADGKSDVVVMIHSVSILRSRE